MCGARRAARHGGGQRRYSDLAIETCLMLRTAYHLGLRQTQGLMGSIGTLMGLDIRVPDYSTLSRRANGVSIAQVMRQEGSVPIHLVVDSTGLKIFGEGEWLAQKHNTKGIRRRWRKLHLGLDLASGAIVCAALTHDNVGDSTALPGLLDQLDAPVTGFLADGAYDGASTRNLLRQRYGETLDVVIPPPKDAVIRLQSARDATVRDRHIAQIRSNGRMAWQTATGYNQRSRIETQMGRWKSVIGPKFKCRSFSRQITEIQLGRKSPEHNDRARTACVRTHRLTLPLGERGNSVSIPIRATRLPFSLPLFRPLCNGIALSITNSGSPDRVLDACESVDDQCLKDQYRNCRFDNQQVVGPSDDPQRDDEGGGARRWMPDVQQDHEGACRGQGKCRTQHALRKNAFHYCRQIVSQAHQPKRSIATEDPNSVAA